MYAGAVPSLPPRGPLPARTPRPVPSVPGAWPPHHADPNPRCPPMPKAIPPTNWRIAGPYDAVPSPTPLVNWRRPRLPPAAHPAPSPLSTPCWPILPTGHHVPPPRPPSCGARLRRRRSLAPSLPRSLAPLPPTGSASGRCACLRCGTHRRRTRASTSGPPTATPRTGAAALRPPSPGASRSPRGPRTSAFAFLQTLRPPLGGSPAPKRTAVETRLRGNRFTIGWSVRAYGTGPHLHARSTPGMGLPQSVPFRRVQGHLTRRLTRHRRSTGQLASPGPLPHRALPRASPLVNWSAGQLARSYRQPSPRGCPRSPGQLANPGPSHLSATSLPMTSGQLAGVGPL